MLAAGGNGDVELAVLPGVDHRYARAATPRDRFESYRTGRFEGDPAPIAVTGRWRAAHVPGAGAVPAAHRDATDRR